MLQQIQIMAQLLRSCRHLIFASMMICMLSFVLVLFTEMNTWVSAIFFILTIILIIMQLYLNIRIRFDAEILQKLADHPMSDLEQQTQSLDTALVTLKFMPEMKQGRLWSQRLQGCVRLVRWHIGLLLLQFLVLVSIVIERTFL
ncbi:hypothetical protein [Acinetobacter sp. MB5]|uniref:hypothetical protein n=1 Tax=Acinetobacter sp. MB5 TaxID=2069438 RepID=UPI000DD0B12D|nr:hypothetical protein [Acinetobacter sp. MB5]